jgi:hypothetical protein
MKIWQASDDWFHESNIQKAIKDYLKLSFGDPTKESDCLKKEKGPDLFYEEKAIPAFSLQVEVKGFPSDKYTNGMKQGQKKRTSPKLQAKHWFAEALLSLIRAKEKDAGLLAAMGIPKMAVYERLWEETKGSMKVLGITCFWVSEDGTVTHSGH